MVSKTGTVNYTVSVDGPSGNVVVTPPSGYIGTMEVLVYVRPHPEGESDTFDVFDTQLVNIVVTPDVPLGVNLLATSDSGVSDSDNLTNATALQFEVTGVTDGALVRLHNGSSVIGQDTASGTSVTITTSNLDALGDGTYSLFATQIIDNVESPASATLDVTMDTAPPPAFTSTPPTIVTVNTLLSYNAENPQEGSAGTTYSLVGAPAGVTINATSGVLSWTPGTNQVGTHQFAVAIVDAAGNSRTQDLDILVATDALVGFRIELTDRSFNPISSIDVGGEFELRVFVADISADPRGVFAAYLDVLYDQQLVVADGPLSWGPSYPNSHVGSLASPGIIDEAGAFGGFSELGGAEYLFLSLPMKAIFAGDALFQTDAADNLPTNELLRYGDDFEVEPDEVVYGSTVLTVNPAFEANDDVFRGVDAVAEDSVGSSLDPLANDEVFAGSPGELTIIGVGTTDHGGLVEIATDGKSLIYTPLANFFGDETFTYTVSDTAGTRTASITVEVTPKNDDPTATDDDDLEVMEDAR